MNPEATSESASLAASEGSNESPIMFHRVPEPKTVKNRLHLDLITADFDAELARLLRLGATTLATFEWCTRAAARASRRNEVCALGLSICAGVMSFNATSMRSRSSKAL